MSKKESLEKFKEIFWDAFHKPKLKSKKVLQVYLELEQLNSILAGPLYSIYEKGSCNFIFEDDVRFPNVKNNSDFFERNIFIITHYKDKVEELVTETQEEIDDVKILLYQVDIKMELADLAFDILE